MTILALLNVVNFMLYNVNTYNNIDKHEIPFF